MKNTSNEKQIDLRDMYYFRQRQKNKVFQQITQRFYELAKSEGLTQKELAIRARKDVTRLNKIMAGPGNFTLDTISDLLLAMGAEMTCQVTPFEQPKQSAETKSAIKVHLKDKQKDIAISETFSDMSAPNTANGYSFGFR